MKKKSKAGKIILIIALVVVVIGVVIVASAMSAASKMTLVEPIKLEKTDLENTVSFSGLVESSTFERVSSSMNYPVIKINVKEGDEVKKGDILATLDSHDIENQILQQQATIDSSDLSSSYNVSDAERSYLNAQSQIENGTYPEIRSAQLALDNAKDQLEKAKEKYFDQVATAGSEKDTTLISANQTLNNARTELEYAKQDLEQAKREKENEDYGSIRAYKKALDEATKDYEKRYKDTDSKNAIEKAKKEFEDAQSYAALLGAAHAYELDNVTSEQVQKAEEAVEKAKQNLKDTEKKYGVETKEETYEDALIDYTVKKASIDAAHDSSIKTAQRAYDRAQESIKSAENSLNSVLNSNSTTKENYEKAVADAEKAVEQAQESYDIAVKNANNNLSQLKAAADKTRVLSDNNSSQLISLEILKERLDECVIVAPCDGTVTVVNVTEGNLPQNSGVLFLIENTHELQLTSSVKEFNIASIKEGDDVKVNIPSLSKDYEGTISKISVAGTKGADFKNDGNASFKVNVAMKDTDGTGVLIGMTGKAKLTVGKADNVYAVGYDCIATDDNDKSHICVLETDEKTKASTVKFIPVELGFEADASVEIKSSELYEGLEILPNASDYTEGQIVVVNPMIAQAEAKGE
ncbi:MAG: HlyD family efflux transporter periplasmic adaptor subunit [Oscillospiraceae bacterium]|nr:HlyD family efflux transporter periplasmic adaptor subunit [Oscillospiraceae bacterium]